MTRQAQITRVSVVGIIGNVILVVFKAIVGAMVGSVAIIADALNNLADAGSSVVTLLGAKLAARRPDRRHPYGYGQIEYLSSMAIALLILYTGISTFVDSFNKILHPEEVHYDAAAIIVIAGGIVVKVLLGRYFKKRGAQIDSEALTASGADASLDAVVSASILVGAVITTIWNISLDGWLGAAIAVVIVKSGVDVLRASVSRIVGERVSADTARALKHEIESWPQVLGVYDLILNRYGPERTIGSVHIQVPDAMTAMEIDALSRKIAGRLYTEKNIIMTIGIYAANDAMPIARDIRRTLQDLTADVPEILQVHGFYVDEPEKQVSFDMVMDFGCENADEIRAGILRKLREEYPDYSFHAVEDVDFSD